MKKQIILTIGRQLGSCGRTIGHKLADKFGLTFYDKELLNKAANESGLCEEVFEKADEKPSSGLPFLLALSNSPYYGAFSPFGGVLSNDRLFKIQSDVIREIASKESCVIVGRCADYVLRDNPNVISFFIANTMEERIKELTTRQQLSVEKAKDLIIKTDKSRANYYNFFTNKTWGAAASYDLSINVSVLGIEKTVDYLGDFVEKVTNAK